ncbi:uncharacterized protein PG986_010108 [Apiospora aurea]|uniref:Rhodopsin domain-containing protein n=1 Tax=Apiospora aurea TaxID=335848 RepID=A0ABR1Q9L2_9PEZI
MLPLGMLRNLQMPILRKLSLAVLFALGVLCIITATIRVVEIGRETTTRPSLTWLAMWSTIESSVGPHENLDGNTKTTIGGGFDKRSARKHRRIHDPNEIPLTMYSTVTSTSVTTRNASARGESEEDLVKRELGESIAVRRSVTVDR